MVNIFSFLRVAIRPICNQVEATDQRDLINLMLVLNSVGGGVSLLHSVGFKDLSLFGAALFLIACAPCSMSCLNKR